MPNVSGRESLYLVVQSLLTLLLFTMGSFVPFLGFWGTLFCPLPLGLVGCNLGGHRLVAGFGITLFLMWLFFPESVVLYYVLARAPLSFMFYAASVMNTKRLSQTCGEGLFLCTVVALLSELLLLLVFYLLTGQNILLPNVSQVEAILQQLQSGMEPSQADALNVLVQQMSIFIPRMLPAMLLIYAGVDAVLNYKLCAKFSNRLMPLPPFSDWRFPRSLLPALCFAFMAGLLADWQGWFEAAMFTVNLKIVLNILFYLQGFSLAWWWMGQKNFVGILRGVLFVLMLFPLLWLWVVMLGVLDMILDVRTKKSAAK